jgi:aspartate aminotransferase
MTARDPSRSTGSWSLPPSAILAVAEEVRAHRAQGHDVLDLSIGDFGPEQRCPPLLLAATSAALAAGETRYPSPAGQPRLREAIAALYAAELGWPVRADDLLVATGARPLIFAAYATLVRPGEVVLDPQPSWSTDAYAALVGARRVEIPGDAATGFLPRPAQLAPHLPAARLLSLCSPGNPTGATFEASTLAEICALVRDENRARTRRGQTPLFLLWDQVYWQTLVRPQAYAHPLVLCPELAPHTVVIDGGSKGVSAATGLRVGWGAVAAPAVRARMRDLLDHVGTWAPTPLQSGFAALLESGDERHRHRAALAAELALRRGRVVEQIRALSSHGWPFEVLDAAAGFYVAARLALPGEDGETARRRLLARGGLAVVPFAAFGLAGSPWCRLAVAAPALSRLDEVGARIARASADTTGIPRWGEPRLDGGA